jgi:hypothetical protein
MNIETTPQKREASRETGGGGNRLDDLYNLQARTEQPRKRIKKDSKEDEYHKVAQPSFTRRSNGIVGDYMKPEEGKAVSLMVDLTKGMHIITFLAPLLRC